MQRPPNATDLRAARILRKLAALRERRPDTFGAGGHRYELAPPLTEEGVRALEQRHGVLFPEDFRVFLTQVAASGAGPYYGIVPPPRWGDALYGDSPMADFAARPCVWTPDLPRDEATWTRVAGDMEEPFQGAITIADQGCACYVTLVVTGPARGRVMYVSLDGGVPFFPENPDFLSWYERWLDELPSGFRHFWFGTGMPGDEATLAAAARPEDGPRRLDALHAMHQLPALREGTREVVAARVRDEDPAVRAAALGVVAKFKLGQAVASQVRRALKDGSPEVRIAALRALVEGDSPFVDEARRALEDTSEEVITTAARLLEKARALTEADLLPLVRSRSTAVRTTAVMASREVPSARLFDAILAELLAGSDDPHSTLLLGLLGQVRLDAVDEPRREQALDLVLARLRVASGPEPPTAAIHGLGAFVSAHRRAEEALIGLTRHPEPFYRFEAAAVLGDNGTSAALPALRALTADTAMPKAPNRSTAWSVGENARRAIDKIALRGG